ncbi:MAG: hypothetical protein KJ058_12275 [Thermoanaerobaculia bacterium]|nr:hypothetical protein [Thermoanaerobaculia bacterium]
MRAGDLFRLLFVLYCAEVGVLLLLLPWGPAWDRVALQLPSVDLRSLALSSWSRGAVTGFGSVHLVWGIHDLSAWLHARLRPAGRPRLP